MPEASGTTRPGAADADGGNVRDRFIRAVPERVRARRGPGSEGSARLRTAMRAARAGALAPDPLVGCKAGAATQLDH